MFLKTDYFIPGFLLAALGKCDFSNLNVRGQAHITQSLAQTQTSLANLLKSQ